MTRELVTDELMLNDGVISGPLRRSVNGASNQKGSIHDDATASKLGFRGGTVAGSIHLDLFPPLLLKAFGQRWFERGALSMYFLNATVDREPVRAFLRQPEEGARDAQVDAWVVREDGMDVAKGTASVGSPGEPTALLKRPLDRFDAGDLRILNDMKPGELIGPIAVSMPSAIQSQRMPTVTEPLDWYTDASPWGGPIVTPAGMVSVLYAKPMETLRGRIGKGVGLFGAIELRNVNGPVFVDQQYNATGHIVAIGQSPRTEYMWYETAIDDDQGKRVAEMRMLLRWMKASSPAYAE